VETSDLEGELWAGEADVAGRRLGKKHRK